jgi:hypothetical protein
MLPVRVAFCCDFPISGRGGFVPRPRKPDDEKKHSITISLPGWLLKWLREHGKPSKLIETLLLRYKEEVEKKD